MPTSAQRPGVAPDAPHLYFTAVALNAFRALSADLERTDADLRRARTVRTPQPGVAVALWLDACDRRLHVLAGRSGAGRAHLLGEVTFDPVLHCREQLLTNDDVWLHRTANERTVDAFEELAKRLVDENSWTGR